MVEEGTCDNFQPNLFRPKICKNCMRAKSDHEPEGGSAEKQIKEEESVQQVQTKALSQSEVTDPAKRVCAVPPFGVFQPKTGSDDIDFKEGADLIEQRLAVTTSNLWPQGHQLTIKFLDNNTALQEKVKPYIQQWFDLGLNLSHTFVDSGRADIRIDFVQDDSSWSYVGTDAKLERNNDRPTLHLGWLTTRTAEEEIRRVVLHEFGHALGAIHEHQSPESELQWNVVKVYDFFQGPPNNWDKMTIDFNIIDKASASQSQYSAFDIDSIMLYWFDPEWLLNDPPLDLPENSALSETDKEFMKSVYPKIDISEPVEHKDQMSLNSVAGGRYLTIEGNSVKLSDSAQNFQIQFESGDGGQFENGSTISIADVETGIKLDVEGMRVQARWTEHHPYQLFSIERASGDGPISEGDIVYLWNNEWTRYLDYDAERDRVLCHVASHKIEAQWTVRFKI